jgi:hypothetical protein
MLPPRVYEVLRPKDQRHRTTGHALIEGMTQREELTPYYPGTRENERLNGFKDALFSIIKPDLAL